MNWVKSKNSLICIAGSSIFSIFSSSTDLTLWTFQIGGSHQMHSWGGSVSFYCEPVIHGSCPDPIHVIERWHFKRLVSKVCFRSRKETSVHHTIKYVWLYFIYSEINLVQTLTYHWTAFHRGWGKWTIKAEILFSHLTRMQTSAPHGQMDGRSLNQVTKVLTITTVLKQNNI